MANTKVYKVQGGDELVVESGGKITLKEGASIDGIAAANVPDSEATTVAGCVTSINAILAALKAAGLMVADAE